MLPASDKQQNAVTHALRIALKPVLNKPFRVGDICVDGKPVIESYYHLDHAVVGPVVDEIPMLARDKLVIAQTEKPDSIHLMNDAYVYLQDFAQHYLYYRIGIAESEVRQAVEKGEQIVRTKKHAAGAPKQDGMLVFAQAAYNEMKGPLGEAAALDILRDIPKRVDEELEAAFKNVNPAVQLGGHARG